MQAAGNAGEISRDRARAFAQYVAPTLLGVARRALDLAELEDGDAVLDVATGSGLAAFLAAERVGREGTVIGLDDAPAMLEVAEVRASAAGHEQIRWQQGDPTRLTFADESFDAVLCLQTLPAFPRPDAVLEELRRVLVERGRLVVTMWGARAANEWIDLVERALRQAQGAAPASKLARLPDLHPSAPAGAAGDPRPAPRPFRLLQPSNLEVLLQAAGFEEIEVGRLTDRLRFQDVDGLWHWAGASREWGGLLSALPGEVRERVRAALAAALAARHRRGEATVGREIVYARAIGPPAP